MTTVTVTVTELVTVPTAHPDARLQDPSAVASVSQPTLGRREI